MYVTPSKAKKTCSDFRQKEISTLPEPLCSNNKNWDNIKKLRNIVIPSTTVVHYIRNCYYKRKRKNGMVPKWKTDIWHTSKLNSALLATKRTTPKIYWPKTILKHFRQSTEICLWYNDTFLRVVGKTLKTVRSRAELGASAIGVLGFF